MKKTLGIIAMLMVISIATWAQDAAPRVDRRQHNQRLRIRAGIATGDLTHREAVRLRAAQMYIRRGECLARADGQISRTERIRLHRMQQHASRQIYRLRHDRQNRQY